MIILISIKFVAIVFVLHMHSFRIEHSFAKNA